MANTQPRTVSAWLFVGPLLLGAGIWIGQQLPPLGRPDRVWSGPPDEVASQARLTGPAGPPTLAPVVEKVAPGVVTVRAILPMDAMAQLPEGDERSEGDSATRGVRNGSGFIVHVDDTRVLVVTSRHIVADASSIVVRIQGHSQRRAEVVGEDAATDLAVLRIMDPPPGLTVLELGRSEDLRAGDWIVTIGNPFHFSQTVTAGVVSFVGRHLRNYDLHVTNDFLQFSAPVNPGSSGSPVVDLEGRVVGVTTQEVESAQNISFAIPSRTVKWVLDTMHQSPDGRVRRGFLGIRFASRTGTDDYGKRLEGAVIQEVAEGEPAHRAGLRSRDIVLYCNGHKIVDGSELHERITRSAPGSPMQLTMLRDGSVMESIEVTVGELGAPQSGKLTH